MSDLQPLVGPYGTLDEDIRHYTGVSQNVSSDGGDGMLLKPGLYGSLLVSVPICSNDWLHHQHLQGNQMVVCSGNYSHERNPQLHREASIQAPSQVQQKPDTHRLSDYGTSVVFNALQSG